ncbi:NADH-ubiquinone oxidoreductase-F iron-sulfur binding region domain-containing protein [Intestinibacter sp.]
MAKSKKGWQNQKFIDKYCKDWDKAKKWFENVDIDECLRVCKIPRNQAEEFARILTTKKWGLHQDLGLFYNRHSTVSSYLCITLMIICGMCLVKGGNVPPECVIGRGINCDERDPKVWRTPVTNRFPVVSIYPPAVIPEEILGDNEDRIRIGISALCNPLRSFSNSEKMEEALKALELLVVIEHTEVEATKIADYVLPAMNSFEGNGDFNIFTLNYPEIIFASRKRVLEPLGEAKEEAMIFAELTQAMGLIPKIPDWMYKAAEEAVETGDRMKYFAKVVAWFAAGHMKYFDQAATIIALTLGKAYGSASRAMSWAGMLIGPLNGYNLTTAKVNKKRHPILSRMPVFKEFCKLDAAFEEVDKHPQGAIIGYSDEENLLKNHIRHKDGKFHMWCEEIENYIERITPEREKSELKLKDEYNMILSAGRHFEGGANNSMRNPATFKYRNPYTLAMNPDDAKEMGFEDGEMVRVSTEVGSLNIPVEYTWQTSRGYCLIPHNFGLKFKDKTYGTHVNLITKNEYDELTGNSIWRYVPCKVEKITDINSLESFSKEYIVDNEDEKSTNKSSHDFNFKSCGKCTPCREGMWRISELMNEVSKGKNVENNIKLIKELHKTISLSVSCKLGEKSCDLVLSELEKLSQNTSMEVQENE